MKRQSLIILTLILASITLTSCGILSQSVNDKMFFNRYSHGMWNGWEYFDSYAKPCFYGNVGDFVLYSGHNDKWNYCIKVEATNCYLGMKDKKAIKSKRWYEYDGYLVYRISGSTSPEFESKLLVENNVNLKHLFGNQYGKEERRPAKIRIYPKRSGYVYNIFFDDVAIGLIIPWQIAR